MSSVPRSNGFGSRFVPSIFPCTPSFAPGSPQHYGPGVVPPDGPIPADLLGNPWAQEWGNIYPLLGMPAKSSGYDLTELLKAKPVDPRGMVKYAENFFVSMGFPPLPQTFWERSLFTKPADRDVVCHASAWDIDNQDDLRIKVCLQVRDVDFVTVHHELGHNMYQRAYEKQPFLFENGANDGFHEAIGDSIALAITPEYLQKVGLLDQVPSADADIPQLLKQALDRVAFLPFGFTIDQWRWKVFSGEIKPADYNQAWWDLRLKYQGIAPPVARSEQDFDPGAKYHIAGNVPYVRYFLAYILEFQFYRALCHEAGYTGPLNRCTFFGSKEAGAKFQKMLAHGPEQALAGCARSPDRATPDGRQRHFGVFRPAPEVARRTEPRSKGRMVTFSPADRPIRLRVLPGRLTCAGWVGCILKPFAPETEIHRGRGVCAFSEAVLR